MFDYYSMSSLAFIVRRSSLLCIRRFMCRNHHQSSILLLFRHNEMRRPLLMRSQIAVTSSLVYSTTSPKQEHDDIDEQMATFINDTHNRISISKTPPSSTRQFTDMQARIGAAKTIAALTEVLMISASVLYTYYR